METGEVEEQRDSSLHEPEAGARLTLSSDGSEFYMDAISSPRCLAVLPSLRALVGTIGNRPSGTDRVEEGGGATKKLEDGKGGGGEKEKDDDEEEEEEEGEFVDAMEEDDSALPPAYRGSSLSMSDIASLTSFHSQRPSSIGLPRVDSMAKGLAAPQRTFRSQSLGANRAISHCDPSEKYCSDSLPISVCRGSSL